MMRDHLGLRLEMNTASESNRFQHGGYSTEVIYRSSDQEYDSRVGQTQQAGTGEA